MSNKTQKSNDIFIGNKRLMNYVTGVVMQLNSDSGEVSIKARGKYISKAVDVAEVARNRFVPDALVKEVKIGSEEFKGENDKVIKISTIEIILAKK